MGWVAAAALTFAAGFAVYYVKTIRGKDVEHKVLNSEVKVRHVRSSEEIGSEQSAPLIQIEEEESSAVAPSASEDSSIKAVRLSIPSLMPPPPRPPPARSSSPPRLKPPTFGLMPAPPRPANGSVRPPPSAAASLRVPQTKSLPNAAFAPGTSTLGVPNKKSRKIMLQPGYSPLDWASLTANPKANLRGKDAPKDLMRVTPSRLKQQTGRKGKDAWTVYQGKVYNITPYLPFHPGGEPELMKGAGRDAAQLFMEVHPWVNWEAMLGECLVGILVSEVEGASRKDNSGGLDDMD